MPDLLVTAAGEAQLDRLRRISPPAVTPRPTRRLFTAVLYGVVLPRDRSRAPNLKWIRSAWPGERAHQHLYSDAALALTTASGVRGHGRRARDDRALALAHRVPRMVSGKAEASGARRTAVALPCRPGAQRNARRHRLQHRPRARGLPKPRSPCAYSRASAVGSAPIRLHPAGTRRPEGACPTRGSRRRSCTRCSPRRTWSCARRSARDAAHDRRSQLAAMKRTAYFINVGRGLASRRPRSRGRSPGRIAGAAVTSSRRSRRRRPSLYGAPNAILSPHVSASSRATTTTAARCSRRICGAIWTCAPLLNLVDRARILGAATAPRRRAPLGRLPPSSGDANTPGRSGRFEGPLLDIGRRAGPR